MQSTDVQATQLVAAAKATECIRTIDTCIVPEAGKGTSIGCIGELTFIRPDKDHGLAFTEQNDFGEEQTRTVCEDAHYFGCVELMRIRTGHWIRTRRDI